jgi:hypothetical protein
MASTTSSLRGWTGRTFLHPALDYTLIGGGASLLFVLVYVANPSLGDAVPLRDGLQAFFDPPRMAWLILLLTGTHFAASTVRLYTKPGAVQALPTLSRIFPLAMFASTALCVGFWAQLGPHVLGLYYTWSPFHYAAQAYGLTIMYCHLSGAALADRERRAVRIVSLLPFAWAVLASPGAGLQWLLPGSVIASGAYQSMDAAISNPLRYVSMAAPLALYAGLCLFPSDSKRERPPLIMLFLLFSNAVWWCLLPAYEAFIWATFFHGIQYLTIVAIFHVHDQQARPSNQRGPLFHTLSFYGMCLALAYALFDCLPQAFVFAGFDLTASLLLIAAAINLHHFIVDGFIWKLRRGDPNRSVVEDSA